MNVAELQRHPEWLARLDAVRLELEGVQLKYGDTDCGYIGARCVDAVLGTEFTSTLTYSSAREAVKFLQAHKGNLNRAVSTLIGTAKYGPPTRRGDIGQVGKHSLAVCFGAQTLALTQLGFTAVDRRQLQPWHWRVGV